MQSVLRIEGTRAIAPTREQILRLEQELLKLPQVQFELVHYFADGLYARQITIPAGVMLTGRVHKREHLNIISKGELTVWTEDGMKRLRAPYTIVSRPGTKRVGYAHEETIWTTIHATTERDIEKLEMELTEPPFELLVDADSSSIDILAHDEEAG